MSTTENITHAISQAEEIHKGCGVNTQTPKNALEILSVTLAVRVNYRQIFKNHPNKLAEKHLLKKQLQPSS